MFEFGVVGVRWWEIARSLIHSVHIVSFRGAKLVLGAVRLMTAEASLISSRTRRQLVRCLWCLILTQKSFAVSFSTSNILRFVSTWPRNVFVTLCPWSVACSSKAECRVLFHRCSLGVSLVSVGTWHRSCILGSGAWSHLRAEFGGKITVNLSVRGRVGARAGDSVIDRVCRNFLVGPVRISNKVRSLLKLTFHRELRARQCNVFGNVSSGARNFVVVPD